MSAAWAALWGLLAALTLEGLDLAGAARRIRTLPWLRPGEPGAAAYSIAAALRCGSAVIAAAGLAAAGQLHTAGAALAAGLAAPLLLTNLARHLGPAPAAGTGRDPDGPPPEVEVPAGGRAVRLLRVRLPNARRKSDDDRAQ